MKLKIIINEKKFVEDAINSSVMPDNISANTMLMYLTKYYFNKDITLYELTNKICDQMEKFNLDVTHYQRYIAENRIKKIFNDIYNGKIDLLRKDDYIPIYKSEYDKIISCDSDKEKKVLFTLYALARYTNRYGWVYYPENDIYKLANTTKTKDNLLSSMIQKGLIKCTKKVNDLKIGVDLSDRNEEIAYKAYSMDHLGNQFIALYKKGYIVCKKCGKLVKIKGKNQHYCDSCSEKMRLETKRNWWKENEKLF